MALDRQKSPHHAGAMVGWTLVIGFGAALVAVLLFAGLAFGLERGFFARLDAAALHGGYILRQDASWLTPIMWSATQLGSVWGLTLQTVFGAAIILVRRRPTWRWELLLLLLAICGAALLNVLLKGQFARERPSLYPSPFTLTSYSFPSGHSMSAAAFYGVVGLIGSVEFKAVSMRRLWIISLVIITALIGVSRIYFAVHYATDVLGGFVAGCGWLIAVYIASHTWLWRRQGPPVQTASAPPR